MFRPNLVKTLAAVLVLVNCRVVVVRSKEVTYEWTLSPVIGDPFSPDCMNTREERRSLFLANKTFPGPLVEADEGDTIIVRITNKSPSLMTSIHWHGIHQKGTPYSDGTSQITQCSLAPSQSQEYVFEAYPPGTHYWHDHGSYSLPDGLSGPIIVHPKDPDPFTYDEERVVFLQDWYIETGTQQHDGLLQWPFNWIGNPNSFLINGKGIAPECQVNGTNYNNSLLCLPSCKNDTLSQISTIHVAAGKVYRFRLINAGQLAQFNFAIAGHKLKIVQVEGTNVEPLDVDSVDIASGQRYDVLVSADQTPGSFMVQTVGRGRNLPSLTGRAVLHYEGSTLEYPAGKTPTHPAWEDTAFGLAQDRALKTLDVSKIPAASALQAAESDIKRYVLVGTQNQIIVNGAPQGLRWAMNNVSNVKSSAPLIGRAYDAAAALGWPSAIEGTVDVPDKIPIEDFDWTLNVTAPGGPGPALGTLKESVLRVEVGDVLEIVLQNARALNGAAEFHPWHSHGYSYWIVGSGEGTYDPAVDVPKYNLENPLYRDTLIVQPLSWIAVRFQIDNPGAWFFHCHILSHQIMGMGFSIVVSPDELDPLPPSVVSCDDHSIDPPEVERPGLLARIRQRIRDFFDQFRD